MKKLIALCAGLLLAVPGFTQVVQIKGVATVKYATVPTDADKERAYQNAQIAAIERYFAESGEAESQNFEAIQGKIEANLDKFLLSTVVLNEQDQPSLRKYSVAVRAELNVAKLKNTLKSASATGQVSTGEKSQMVYVFVGREVASVKAFDERVVKRAEVTLDGSAKTSSSVNGREGESLGRNAISTNASVRKNESVALKQSVKVETGGSTVRKADETDYRVFSLASQKTAVTSVFSQAGYLVADPDFVLGDQDIPSVNKDYSKGNDLAPATMRSIVASLRKANVPLLALATFDVNPAAIDEATGLQRVVVSVTGRVLDLRGALPREIAAVPPVQYFGLGADNATAQTKALKEASALAAREIISRLNAAGVY